MYTASGSKRARVTQSQELVPAVYARGGKKYLKRKYSVPRSLKGTIRTEARKLVDSMTETKEIKVSFNPSGGLRYYNDASTGYWALTNWFPLTPAAGYLDINQGTGQGDRIGNQIRPVSFKIRGRLAAQKYDATTNTSPQPHDVMIIIYQQKELGSSDLDASLGGLFQDGSTTLSPGSNWLDTVRQFNYDKYNILKVRKIKVGYANYGGAGVNTNKQSFANNDYSLAPYFAIDVTPKYPKKLTFMDAGDIAVGTQVGGAPIYMAVLISRVDGETPTPGGLQPIAATFQMELKYKDA